MDAVRTLLRDWLGREGLYPNEVIIFHRCCDELEAAIQADTPEECRIQAENERLLRVVGQVKHRLRVEGNSIVVAGIVIQGRRVHCGHKDSDPDLYAQLKGVDRG